MAEPSGATAKAGEEVMFMHENREVQATEKKPGRGSSTSEDRTGGDADSNIGNPDPLAHLPEHFRKEIEEQTVLSARKVSFKVRIATSDITYSEELFQFAGSREKLLMFVGSIFALGSGAAFPLMTIIFGSVIFILDAFLTNSSSQHLHNSHTSTQKANRIL